MPEINKLIVVALGGSIVVSKNIQTDYLRRLHAFIEEQMKLGRRFLLVVGGGSIARQYQQAASAVVPVEDEDKDWLGIHSTRINAHLLRTIFVKDAYPIVLDNPEKVISRRDLNKYKLFIASGWRPGWSTDYIAICFAHRFKISHIVIATKISHVYTKDITKRGAKPIKKLTWSQYTRLLPKHHWEPGMKAPVDPVATAFAKKHNISCTILRGTNLHNLKRHLDGKPFEGTVINNK